MPHVPAGKRMYARALACALPLLVAFPGAGENSPASSAVELPEAETRGRDTPRTTAEAHRIEGEDLRRFASLEEAVASLPGFRVRRQGGLGGYSELSFRGVRASRIDIYVDGIRLNQDGDGAPDLSKWPLLWFSSLEARTGLDPGGAGPGSLARIDLSTHGEDRTGAHVRGGSHSTLETAVTARGQGAWQWSVGVQGQYGRNDYPFFNDNGTTHNTGDDEITRMENNGYRSRGFRASALRGNGYGRQFFSLIRMESRKEYSGLNGAGSRAHTVRGDWLGAWRLERYGGAVRWETGIQARRFTDSYRDPERTLGHLSHEQGRVSTAVEADARGRVPVSDRTAFLGDLRLRGETVDPTKTPFSQNMSSPAARRLEAGFGSRIATRPHSSLSLVAEVRVAAIRFGADGVRSYPDAPVAEDVVRTRVPVALRAALEWDTPAGTFGMVARREQRAPSSTELLGDNHGVQANTALRPEETLGIGFLHALNHGAWRGRWEVYWNGHADPIRLGAHGASPFLRYENRADHRVSGLEVSGGWTARRLEIAAALAVARAAITEGLHAGNRPAHHSPAEARAEIFLKPIDGARLGPMLDFRSPWYPGDANIPASRRDAEWEWGAHAGFQRGPASLALDIRNLANRQYRDFVYSPRSGRTWSLRLSLNL